VTCPFIVGRHLISFYYITNFTKCLNSIARGKYCIFFFLFSFFCSCLIHALLSLARCRGLKMKNSV
jgi:hypothetical protein